MVKSKENPIIKCPDCGKIVHCKSCGATIRVPQVECLRCGHRWTPTCGIPKVCAKCHSAYWNTPRKGEGPVNDPEGSVAEMNTGLTKEEEHYKMYEQAKTINGILYQPKQGHYDSSVSCQVCGEDKIILVPVEGMIGESYVSALLCPVCREIFETRKVHQYAKDWLAERGVMNNQEFIAKLTKQEDDWSGTYGDDSENDDPVEEHESEEHESEDDFDF